MQNMGGTILTYCPTLQLNNYVSDFLSIILFLKRPLIWELITAGRVAVKDKTPGIDSWNGTCGLLPEY